MKILIIEDDAGLNRGICFALEQENYEVFSARTMQEGEQLYNREKPDAVILDLNLPDGDGIDLCRRIREYPVTGLGTAVLILTARDLEVDEIRGLLSGADDYITKPFSVSVLKIRLKNILNRKLPKEEPAHLVGSGEVVLDTKAFKVYRGGQEVDLSMTQFRLLQYFLENKNHVLSKEQILNYIWDGNENYVEENTLSVNISRLRKKLGSNDIRTIQGIGYLWEEA